jgi:hypothetical protein
LAMIKYHINKNNGVDMVTLFDQMSFGLLCVF